MTTFVRPVGVACALVGAISAHEVDTATAAQWLRLRSPQFVVVGDASE
jgi:hypothetical protein